LNRNFFGHEWGAVAFVGTIILGGFAVLVALLVKAATATPLPGLAPCPKFTPIVIQATPTPSPGASPSATPPVALPSVLFGCPEPSVVVQTPTPSPAPSASAKATPKATVTPKATASASPKASSSASP
jgi:hypothetical protein